jgi:small-conductance mechanosensitive channel
MLDWNQILKVFEKLESNALMVQLAQFFAWVLFITLITALVRGAIDKAVKDNALRYKAKKVTRLLSYVLLIFLAIVTFTGNVQYFTIAIGLFTAGLAFALQEVILSLAGWLAIVASNIYETGDRIELNNVKGDVIDIGLTKTTLMEIGEWVKSDNYSGRIVQVSNAFVFKGPVRNYSTDFPFVWDEIDIPIHFGSDIQLANDMFQEIAHSNLSDYANYAKDHWQVMVKKYLIEDANVEPSITLKLTDNWVEFNIRFVVDFKKRKITKDALYKSVLSAIDATDGKVKMASTTIEIVK